MDQKVLHQSGLTNTVCVVVGTRPGIIKFSPVVRALQAREADFFLAHTGQHYSYNMDRQFFEELGLPEPRYKNETVQKASLHGAQTAEMIKGLEQAFLESRPGVVIVGGDANTNLAGALAARKLGIPVAHMEAGLRSHDWRMPEEHNRVMIDHISELLYPPTEQARQNLVADNVKGEILVTGNTIVGAVHQNMDLAARKSWILDDLNLEPDSYLLVTVHREENVDHPDIFGEILSGLEAVAEEIALPMLFPMHPRTRKRVRGFGLEDQLTAIPGLKVIEPVGYLDFLMLTAKARLVLTDSGGIQEETCILQVPCVTLRENTERPETVEAGSNVVAGTRPDGILQAARTMLDRDRAWVNPFGDHHAGERIADSLLSFLEKRRNA